MDVDFQETLWLQIIIYAHATAQAAWATVACTAELGQETLRAGTVHHPHPATLSTSLEVCRVALVLQAITA